MQLKIRKLNPAATIPEYATAGSAGLDLSACVPHEIYLQPGVRYTCMTGIAVELPDGFEAQIRPRSGMAKKVEVAARKRVAKTTVRYWRRKGQAA